MVKHSRAIPSVTARSSLFFFPWISLPAVFLGSLTARGVPGGGITPLQSRGRPRSDSIPFFQLLCSFQGFLHHVWGAAVQQQERGGMFLGRRGAWTRLYGRLTEPKCLNSHPDSNETSRQGQAWQQDRDCFSRNAAEGFPKESPAKGWKKRISAKSESVTKLLGRVHPAAFSGWVKPREKAK